MKSDKIIEGKKYVKKNPNLQDYDRVVSSFSYKTYTQELTWFDKDTINAAYNAITRNTLSSRKNKLALLWESEEGEKKKYTFADIEEISNQIAHYLRHLGIEKGDRVFLFLPRIPELYFSFIAILKIGAVAGTLFSAFGPQALFDRLSQSGAKVLITTEEMAKRVQSVRKDLDKLEKIVLVNDNFTQEIAKMEKTYKVSHTHSEDNAFMLYTSGTTGKPKGIVHAHRAIIHQYLTAQWALDIQEDDVYWCTADPGWVTGIAYGILGSWANGATSIVYEGRFSPQKWYQILQDYEVTIWYTAPTAIRMLP